MAVSSQKIFIPGVWGAFWSAMVPGFWLTEGGQSATGSQLDHLIANHAAGKELANLAASKNISVYELLSETLEELTSPLVPFQGALTKDLHVLPDFHGNRSLLADPNVQGVITGLSLDNSIQNLSLTYLAAIQAIAYGTPHIVEHCNEHGLKIDTLLACGRLSKSRLYMQQHADIIGFPILLSREKESVLLGAAILGAVAAKKFNNVREAMVALHAPGMVIKPSEESRIRKYHDAKYKIFKCLYEQQQSYRQIMHQSLS